MIALARMVNFISGTPQFRITEDASGTAPEYYFYSQMDLEDDLRGAGASHEPRKLIRTFDDVSVVSVGDVIFSLVSGTASMVQSARNGYLFTQNYVVLSPSGSLDPSFLVYLLNENADVRRQLHLGQQGSITMKYTLRQLKCLKVPLLPPKERQRLIGELYLDQLRLDALRKAASELETTLMLEALRKAVWS